MRIKLHTNSNQKAYALLLTMVFVGIILILFGSMMVWVSTNAKVTTRNNLYNQSQAAAESSVELVVSTMMRDFANQNLNAASSYQSIIPLQTNWPIQFAISGTNFTSNSVSVFIGPTNWTSLPSQYSGLNGLGQECVVSAVATALNQSENVSAPISQRIWFGSIPIFQFAIFYNLDLEVNPGALMNVNGKVHSNQNIWASGSSSSAQLIFSDIVEAAQQVNLSSSPKDPQNNGRKGNVSFTLTDNNPKSNANSLNLPIGGTNRDPIVIRGILGLPPSSLAAPNAAAYAADGQLYPYNQADLIISNSPSLTNITVYYQNGNIVTPLTKLSPDVTNIVSGRTNLFFSFVTNVSFYDYREYANVKAVQIDIAKLRQWFTNRTATGGLYYNTLNATNPSTSKGHQINSIYVYNAAAFTNGTTSRDGQLPAVRVVNGYQLPPAGLTIASPQPMYVEGDYNTTRDGSKYAMTLGSTTNNATRPAAFMADAITILSTNWDDSLNIKGKALGQRQPTDTTVNAACFEGIVPSDYTNYSGGVENFMRLLEDWSSKKNGSGKSTLTYNGSIVVMFPSQYGMHPWQSGAYYNPPNRQWGFDTTFYTLSGIPPMTPQVKAVIRETWLNK